MCLAVHDVKVWEEDHDEGSEWILVDAEEGGEALTCQVEADTKETTPTRRLCISPPDKEAVLHLMRQLNIDGVDRKFTNERKSTGMAAKDSEQSNNGYPQTISERRWRIDRPEPPKCANPRCNLKAKQGYNRHWKYSHCCLLCRNNHWYGWPLVLEHNVMCDGVLADDDTKDLDEEEAVEEDMSGSSSVSTQMERRRSLSAPDGSLKG